MEPAETSPSAGAFEIFLVWRGHAASFLLSPASTIADILRNLAGLHPTASTAQARVIWRGKTLVAQSTESVSSLGIKEGSKLLLFAQTLAEAAAGGEPTPQEQAVAHQVRNDVTPLATTLGNTRQRVRRVRPKGTVAAGEPGFGRIEVIETLPEWRTARAYLRAIATHPGVLAVMKARGWHVPVLGEMPAIGKVGVDPVCVLGFNTNNGASIRLRLRTDDAERRGTGFRLFSTTMDVVWHELAHNLISEHTREFYMLVSTLKREGEAADWRKHGHRLGGDEIAERDPPPDSDSSEVEFQPFQGPGTVLGGAGTTANASPAESAARAALLRDSAARDRGEQAGGGRGPPSGGGEGGDGGGAGRPL